MVVVMKKLLSFCILVVIIVTVVVHIFDVGYDGGDGGRNNHSFGGFDVGVRSHGVTMVRVCP